jgi:curved DNA-binding protein CbpA
MPSASGDPYAVLGVSPGVSDKELHAAYRRLVQLYHPDHNQGSVESARRFEEIQDAYARIRQVRGRPDSGDATSRQPSADPDVDARLADLERELRQAHEARERARRAAAVAEARTAERPSDEELGYVTTDDSFGKIISDIVDEIGDRLSGAREHPAAKRVHDIIDDLRD